MCWNTPHHTVSQQKPTMLDGEMKNGRMLWKVRDRENGEREVWPARKKKKNSPVVMPVEVKKKKKTSGGERKPLSLQLPSTVSRSSVSSYYQCQSAFMGHYEPDMLSVPSRVFAIRALAIYLKMYCSGKDQHILNTDWNVPLLFNWLPRTDWILRISFLILNLGNFFPQGLAKSRLPPWVSLSGNTMYLLWCKTG